MKTDQKVNLAQIVGIVFVVFGILGAIGWFVSIDTNSGSDSIDDELYTYSEQKKLASQEKNTKVIYSISTFLGGLGVGTIVYSLGTIQGLLEIQVSGRKSGYHFNIESVEEEQQDREKGIIGEKEPVNEDVETKEKEESI